MFLNVCVRSFWFFFLFPLYVISVSFVIGVATPSNNPGSFLIPDVTMTLHTCRVHVHLSVLPEPPWQSALCTPLGRWVGTVQLNCSLIHAHELPGTVGSGECGCNIFNLRHSLLAPVPPVDEDEVSGQEFPFSSGVWTTVFPSPRKLHY